MKFKLQLCLEDGSSTSIIEEFYSLDRESHSFEAIGMSLSESKELLKNEVLPAKKKKTAVSKII